MTTPRADAAPLSPLVQPDATRPATDNTATGAEPSAPVRSDADHAPDAARAAGTAPTAASAVAVPAVAVPGLAGGELPVSVRPCPADAPRVAGVAAQADDVSAVADHRPAGGESSLSACSDADHAPDAARAAGTAPTAAPAVADRHSAGGESPAPARSGASGARLGAGVEGAAPEATAGHRPDEAVAAQGGDIPAPRLRVTRVAVERPVVAGTEPVGDGPRVGAVVVGAGSGPVVRPFVRGVPLPRGERAGEEPVVAPPPVAVTPVRLPLPEPTHRPEEPQP